MSTKDTQIMKESPSPELKEMARVLSLEKQSDGNKTGEPSFKYNDCEETQNVQSRASESPQNQIRKIKVHNRGNRY